MNVNQVYIVDELKQKVKLLADKLEAQKSSTSKLSSENVELEDKIKEKDSLINALKQQNNTLTLSKAFVSENGGSQEAKLQINRIVREIDKCIALLNR
ncbi:MAG: hypothetical protein PF450_05430 [Bacteroidales bacterium]|jgi:K+-transporting ATPase c subunit|nr:hypothetical protein [Bacteroidales bacterium]